MSEIGQICRTAAQKAMGMKSPCIQITPVFPNDLEEWAKLYFYFSEMTNAIQTCLQKKHLKKSEQSLRAGPEADIYERNAKINGNSSNRGCEK